LVGAGTVALWRDARRGGLRLVLPLAAVALTAWLEVSILRRSGYLPWIQDLAIAAAAAAGVLLVAAALPGRVRVPRRAWAPAAALGAAVLGFSVAPAAWAETALEAPINGTLPGAGPNFVGSGGFGGGGRTFGGGPSGPGPNLPGLGRPQRGGGFAFGGSGPGGGGAIGPALAYEGTRRHERDDASRPGRPGGVGVDHRRRARVGDERLLGRHPPDAEA